MLGKPSVRLEFESNEALQKFLSTHPGAPVARGQKPVSEFDDEIKRLASQSREQARALPQPSTNTRKLSPKEAEAERNAWKELGFEGTIDIPTIILPDWDNLTEPELKAVAAAFKRDFEPRLYHNPADSIYIRVSKRTLDHTLFGGTDPVKKYLPLLALQPLVEQAAYIGKEADKRKDPNVQEVRLYETYGRSEKFGLLRYKLTVKVFVKSHNQAYDIRLNGTQKNRSSKLKEGPENHSSRIRANARRAASTTGTTKLAKTTPATGELVAIQLIPLPQPLSGLGSATMIRIADRSQFNLLKPGTEVFTAVQNARIRTGPGTNYPVAVNSAGKEVIIPERGKPLGKVRRLTGDWIELDYSVPRFTPAGNVAVKGTASAPAPAGQVEATKLNFNSTMVRVKLDVSQNTALIDFESIPLLVRVIVVGTFRSHCYWSAVKERIFALRRGAIDVKTHTSRVYMACRRWFSGSAGGGGG